MELGKLSDKYVDEERPKAEALMRRDDLAGLEELVLAKVRTAATDESLLTCPKLPEILTFWKDLAGEAEPIAWVSTMGRDDHKLANLLEKFMEKESSHSMRQGDGTPRYRLNQKVLTPFLDPGNLLDRTRTLTGSEWLGEPQKDALRQYIKNSEIKGR